MLRGLPASIILHGAVVFGGAVAWPYIAPEREAEVLIPVTMDVQLDVVTNFAPVVRREVVPEELEEQPEEEVLEEDILEDEDSEEVEIGDDELETTDVRELEQDQAPEEESTEVSEDTEEKDEPDKPEEAEDKQDTARNRTPDSLDDLLSDSSKLFSEVKTSERKPVKKRDKKILVDETQVEDPRKGVGDRSKETARIEALIYSQMIECWDGVLDQPNYERLQVTVTFKLTEDGRLDGDVERVNPKSIPVGDRPMRVAVERALRAARKCAPYRIPKDARVSHDEWKDVILDIGH